MKKIICLFVSVLMLTVSVSAYNFPEPDWGALLTEKKNMVSQTDFELFMEGPVEAAPYYGAKLEPRGGVYFGSVAENADFLGNLGSYLTYFSMEDRQTDIYYPANNIIRENDCVVTVGYSVESLSNVNYDVLRQTLDNLATYGKPMYIRFANEMNVSDLGNDPDRYVQIFRNVANMVHEYDDFAVVWSPNDLGALDRPFEYYYPGDAYVDWIGVSSYGKKYFGGNRKTAEKDSIYFMTGDYAWATNALKPIIAFMERNGIQKPVMLSECGVATENTYGENLESWAAPRLRNLYYNVLMKYPQVKMINYFNTYRPETEKYYVHDTINPKATDKPYAMKILQDALCSGAYIRTAGGRPEFVFVPANAGYTAASADGKIDLYTMAHVPKMPNLAVNYYVDGVWYAQKTEAPYQITLDMAAFADGEHTVRISANGMIKAYTFTKRGNGICFGGEPDPAVIAAASMPETPAPSGEITVVVNGTRLAPDVPPVIISDRTLVPLRSIFEALGADVSWDGNTRTVTATGRGSVVKLTVDETTLYINGDGVEMDVPAQIIKDRTMVPIRAVSESFGCNVEWVGSTRTVIITE